MSTRPTGSTPTSLSLNFFSFWLLVFLLLSTFYSNTQEYIPFPQDSAVWYSVYSYPEAFPPPPFWYYTSKFSAKGDTMLGGVHYTKFYWTGTYAKNSDDYTGAYRVESDSNRVYYLDRWDTTEYLMYDFNLFPADTILVHGNIKYICVDTGSIMLNNGTIHKTQTMFIPSASNCYQIWATGLGSLGLPLLEPYWGCGYTFESAYDLTCFIYKEELLYEWEGNPYFEGCIGSNLGIEEITDRNIFSIAPNPVNGISRLMSNAPENTLFDYEVLDVNGRILESVKNVKAADIILQSSRIKKGIYVLRLYTHHNEQYYSIRFIVN
jgi:Secretion system C-terminal sorting domain